MKSTTRNWGIDMLRIASMLGVVFLHVLGHGGILNSSHSLMNFSTVWFFEILAYPAVNCFVLISGFVGYKDDNISPKIKNILSLMFTVIFYNVSIFLVFIFLGIEPFAINGLSRSFFPTTFKSYWFFSAYFGLFLLSPLLNLLVQKLSLKQAFIFGGIFSSFIIVSAVSDTFSLLGGYSLIWLIFVYLIGAIIKKFKLNELLSKNRWFIIALASFIITWILKISSQYSNISFLKMCSSMLISYVSPTMVLMAVASLCFFSKINCSRSFARIIPFFASSAFSVYLIHDNNHIRHHLISKIHTFIGNSNFVSLTIFIFSIVLAIFVICTLIDKIRIVIFKIAKVEELSTLIEKFIRKTTNSIYQLVEKHLQQTAE